MTALVAPRGHVYALVVDESDIPRLRKKLQAKQYAELLPASSYSFYPATKVFDGLPEQGPYDAIHVAKAVKSMLQVFGFSPPVAVPPNPTHHQPKAAT